MPESMGPFVGGVEVLCGALVILGLLTRLASILLLIDISVAIVSTKVPILLGHGFWGFSLTKLPRYGFLSMVHEARTDFAVWLAFFSDHCRRWQEMVARCEVRPRGKRDPACCDNSRTRSPFHVFTVRSFHFCFYKSRCCPLSRTGSGLTAFSSR